MEAIAEHDFNATAEDELSFRRGQVLKVLFFNRILFPISLTDQYFLYYNLILFTVIYLFPFFIKLFF